MKERKKQQRIRAIQRAAIQILFFLTAPGAFVAGFNGIKRICSKVGAGQELALDSFMTALLFLCLFTILFGRFFCGYVCSFGMLGDLVNILSELIQKKILKRRQPFEFPEKVLHLLQKVKYVVLLLIMILNFIGLYSKLRGSSPWDVYSVLIRRRLPPEGYGTGLVVLILILIGMALQKRFFCQCLCPMGAVFSLLPILPSAHLRRNQENCIPKCDLCKRQCPVKIKLEEDGILNGECISCGSCTPTCPKGNITPQGRTYFVQVIVKTVLFLGAGIILGIASLPW